MREKEIFFARKEGKIIKVSLAFSAVLSLLAWVILKACSIFVQPGVLICSGLLSGIFIGHIITIFYGPKWSREWDALGSEEKLNALWG